MRSEHKRSASLRHFALVLATAVAGGTAWAEAADPTFVLEVPEGTGVCGVFQDGRSLRTEYDLKCRVDLRAASWELPGGATTIPAEFVDSLLFGPSAQPGAPVTAGLFRVQRQSWEPGIVYYI